MEQVVGGALVKARGWRLGRRHALLAIATLLLAASATVVYQYWTEMSAARQRVVGGSEVLRTPRGDVEFAVKGEGAPVLVLHGSGGGYDQGLLFGGMMLGEGYKLIAVSRFGYLRSPVPADSSVEAQAALYADLLDHLGVREVIVVATSGGGPSGLLFAHDFPERTSALVLVSAVSKVMPPGEQNASAISVIQTIQQSDFLYWLATRAGQAQFLEMIGVPPDVYARLTPAEKKTAQEILDVMHPMSQRKTGSFREGEQKPLDLAAMAEIAAPTLIVHAQDDKLVVSEHAENSHQGIKQSKLVLFETGGHALLTRMTTVRADMSAFLQAVK